jgi:hypothetical protein
MIRKYWMFFQNILQLVLKNGMSTLKPEIQIMPKTNCIKKQTKKSLTDIDTIYIKLKPWNSNIS